jgi:hypothetical protein
VIVHLVIGLLLLPPGLYVVIQRDRIVARHQRRNGHAQTAAAWSFLGGLFAVAGALDIVASFL